MMRVLIAAGVAAAFAAGGCAARTTTAGATPTGLAGAQLDRQARDRLPAEIRARGTIRLVTDASYAPMEQFGPDGRSIVGFEPDLAAALGSVLGVQVQMVQGAFDTALNKVAAGDFDGVLSAMTDTPDREKEADFLDYFSAGTSIIVQRGNPKGITDLNGLCGQVVAVEKGTVQYDLLTRSQRGCGSKRMTIRQYPTNADALLELRTGRAAAVLNDFPPAAYVTSDLRTRAYYQLCSTVQYEPGLFGIAFAKNATGLRDAVREALNQLIRSGAYGELLKRWGLSSGGVSASSVNGGAAAGD